MFWIIIKLDGKVTSKIENMGNEKKTEYATKNQ